MTPPTVTNLLLGALVVFCVATAVEAYLLLGRVQLMRTTFEQLLEASRQLLAAVPGKSAQRTAAIEGMTVQPWFPKLRAEADRREADEPEPEPPVTEPQPAQDPPTQPILAVRTDTTEMSEAWEIDAASLTDSGRYGRHAASGTGVRVAAEGAGR